MSKGDFPTTWKTSERNVKLLSISLVLFRLFDSFFSLFHLIQLGLNKSIAKAEGSNKTLQYVTTEN